MPGSADYGFPGFEWPPAETMIDVGTQLGEGVRLTTAVIGAGNIGSAIARNLVGGGETVVLAAKNATHAGALAEQLRPRARAATVEDALADADTVVLALTSPSSA